MSHTPPVVAVRSRGTSRLRSGHPWVFRDDLIDDGGAANGDLVRVVSGARTVEGHAFYSSRSKIALRLIEAGADAPRPEFWVERLRRAAAYRRLVVEQASAYRLLFSESDGIPGLVADRYGEHLVVQSLAAGAERLLPALLAPLHEEHGVRSVLARNDATVRSLEGLPLEVRQLSGQTPEWIEVEEGPIRYRVDPRGGQKTGAFLDQRENRMALAPLCRGRVLDAFCYQGGFALHAARHADEVLAVDSSARAVEHGRTDAARNGLGNLTFIEAKAFDELKRRESAGERFDAVILDPPAFARSRRDVPAAERAYHELNRRALRLLRPDGILITCSCSYNMSEERFIRVVEGAARLARRTARIMFNRTQSRDHPVRLGFSESHYLKCLVLSVM